MKITALSAALGATIAAASMALGTAAPASADAYDELFHWTDWMAKKYGVQIYVNQDVLGSGVYGVASGNTIVYNSQYIANPEALADAMASDVRTGFHRGQHCTATQALAAHESAHVIDWYNGFEARYELATALANGMTGTVSGYSINADGTVNIGETIAEAVVAVECDTPTPAESAIYEMLVS